MTIARAPFEIPARVKTDPILNNYLTQTMENNEVLDQGTDYVNRSSKRVRLMNCFD